MSRADSSLWDLVRAIATGDDAKALRLLAESKDLGRASFSIGATRAHSKSNFLDQIGRYIYEGDTALQIAAAAYRPDMVRKLVTSGADVHAGNRLGDQAIHAAAVGNPGSRCWDPAAQVATIVALIQAGADPNATNKRGVTPLHRAVRTRCAAAVRALLENGADPAQKNGNGSTPMLLARMTTGRGGSGSPEAKAQQKEILRLLEQSLDSRSASK